METEEHVEGSDDVANLPRDVWETMGHGPTQGQVEHLWHKEIGKTSAE